MSYLERAAQSCNETMRYDIRTAQNLLKTGTCNNYNTMPPFLWPCHNFQSKRTKKKR